MFNDLKNIIIEDSRLYKKEVKKEEKKEVKKEEKKEVKKEEKKENILSELFIPKIRILLVLNYF